MLLISFCNSPEANELYGSADEVITLTENEDEIITASPSTTTTISSTTTTLANDYILHLEEITAEKIWLIDFTRRVNEAETEWNNLKITYQEYKEIFSSFIKEAEEFNERVRGIDPPNKYDFLKVSQIDLNILSDIILDDTVELLAGVEEPDTGERTAAALSSFNINSELFVNKVSEIVRLSLSETTLPPTTTTTTTTTVFIPEVKNKITDPPVTFYEISEGKLSIEDYPTVTYELASYIETTTSNCDISLNPSAHEGGSAICNKVVGIGFAYSTIGAVNDSDKRIFSLIDTNLDGTTDYLCAPSVTDYYDDRFCKDVFGTGTGGWVYRNKGNSGWGYEYELINVYAIYKTSEGDYLKLTGLPVSKEYFNDIPDFNNSTYKVEVAYCEMDYISDAYGIDQLTFSQNSRGTSFSPIYCGYESFGRNFTSGDYFFNLRTTVYNDNNENNFISSFAGSNNGILPFDNYSKRLFPK